MIPVFIDTEFTDLHPLEMRLISLGACALLPDGSTKTYYVELTDTYKLSQCSKFVKDIVLPLLEKKNEQTFVEMVLSFSKFIEDLEDDVRLVSDAPSWDYPHIMAVYADKSVCPPNLKALSVAQRYKMDLDVIPEAAYMREHHALDDAIVNSWVVRAQLNSGHEDGIKDVLKINHA